MMSADAVFEQAIIPCCEGIKTPASPRFRPSLLNLFTMTPASTSSSSLDVVVIPADLVSSNFDMFEFARQLFPPVVAFLTDPDYDNFSDKQTRNFLREHQDTLVSFYPVLSPRLC